MTRVNVLLPLFQTTLKTNNTLIIKEILLQKYGIGSADVYWLDSQADECFECVIRLKDLNLTFESALQEIQRRRVAEETLKKVQVDIFNVIKKHQELFQEKKSLIPLERLSGQMGNEVEDSQVSLKIEEKPKQKQSLHSEVEMLTAIRQLTRQNLKLKDAIIFYEAQLQLMKGGESLSMRPR